MNVPNSITYNSQIVETTQCLSTEEWRNQMWYIHTTENHLATKRNEILVNPTTSTSLENLVLSERSQTPKAS